MEELLYSPSDIAKIIRKRDMGTRARQEFVSAVWEVERDFIPSVYRRNQRKFVLDVMDQLNFLEDTDTYQREIPYVNRDLSDLGSKTVITEDKYFMEFDTFFKELRLRIVILDQQDFVRMKLHTMLREHGYKRRSPQLIRHLHKCLYFYHVGTYTRGEVKCDIEGISLDDMISFRVVGCAGK
ncbi:MAG: hypothetical protein LKE53_07720 [Oscillospiraceae bacterium]|jgi:hypothetical protein|nr:hypothetical protein [Oscillospiraceae bacterium]